MRTGLKIRDVLDLSTAKANTEATAISLSFTCQATKIQDLLKSKF
jgi:hypothetical protein